MNGQSIVGQCCLETLRRARVESDRDAALDALQCIQRSLNGSYRLNFENCKVGKEVVDTTLGFNRRTETIYFVTGSAGDRAHVNGEKACIFMRVDKKAGEEPRRKFVELFGELESFTEHLDGDLEVSFLPSREEVEAASPLPPYAANTQPDLSYLQFS